MKKTDQLVLNWHLTETCNYVCRYCYSSWSRRQVGEIFRNPEVSSALLKELYRYFRAENSFNPLQQSLHWKNVRLSLAGGETLLFPEHTLRIAQEAKALGFSLSLITNGSLLTCENVPKLVGNLSMLGISLDSADRDTNRRIGRIDRSGRVVCLDEMYDLITLARACNPELFIKINTVVNSLNIDEDLSGMVERLRPNKWKLLRVLPAVTDALSITDQQFASFVARHRHLGNILSVEDNQDMTESYIMVDPCGRFFQNQKNSSNNNPYIYSEPILDVGADAAFAQIKFDVEKFAGRYFQHEVGDAA